MNEYNSNTTIMDFIDMAFLMTLESQDSLCDLQNTGEMHIQ